MWQPPRFSRLPSDEPREGQPIQMDVLPADKKIGSATDVKNDYQGEYHPVGLDSGYSAGAQNNAPYATSYQHSLGQGSRNQEHHGFKNKFIKTFYGGWRAGLMRSFLFCLLALIANIVIYAYLFGTYNTTAGTATIRSGDCTMIRNSNTAIHAALNIVSTLILGASTYAMQGMTAPTREEVNAAHAKGKWVEIGTQSVRNLFYVRRRNLWVWLLLGVTSLPYHLFFNAVFFTTTQNNQYAMALVDQSILSNSDFQPTLENASPDLFKQFTYHDKNCENTFCRFNNSNDATVFDLLRDLTNSSESGRIEFVRMEPRECMQNYSTGFLREWGDVAVVTSQAGVQSPVLFTRYPERTITMNKEETNQDPFHWICNDVMSSNNTYGDEICSLELALSKFDSGKNWTVYGQPVSHCLARYLPSQCELQFNAWLMLGIVVFGVIKSIVIAFILIARTSGTSMHTLGDAIASFLKHPDPTTEGMCLITSSHIRKHGFHPPLPPQRYTATRPRWLSSANTLEFTTTIAISAIYIIVLATALYFGIDGARGSAFTNGLGAPDIQSLARFQPDDTGSSGIVPTLLIANIPQLGFSILYVVYYSIWGKLLVAHEFDRLTRARKGVRVSERPEGAQRSTRFFTLPVRYAAPLMACSAGLHWLCSQSFFMVRIDGVDGRGAIDPNDRLVRLGYSSRGVVALVALSVAMLAATVCVCVLRTMNTGLGETSMSVVVSAACHPVTREGRAWEEPVQWGDVGVVGSTEDGGVVRRVAFSSGPVERPRVGELYR